MGEKITWETVFDDFKRRHPNLSKLATRYRPLGFLEILIFLSDGSKVAYSFEKSNGWFVA